MTRQINLGFVGCGTHNLRGHAKPALEMPKLFSVAALCDPSEMASIKFARRIGNGGVRQVKRIEELFEIGWIDAVVIGSPDRFHAEQALAAVRAGKHVLVDKPAATSREDLKTLAAAIEIARENNLVLTSCHPRRFNPPYALLKGLMRELPEWIALLGEPVEIALDFSYPVPSSTGLHEGLMIDHVSHEFDYVRWLFGGEDLSYEIRRVFDAQDRYHATGSVEGNGRFVALAFTGTRQLAFGTTDERVYPEWIRIRFAQGDLELETSTGRLRVRDHRDGSMRERRLAATNYEHAFRLLMEDFHRSIFGAAPCLAPDDVLRNSEIGVELMRKRLYRLAPGVSDRYAAG